MQAFFSELEKIAQNALQTASAVGPTSTSTKGLASTSVTSKSTGLMKAKPVSTNYSVVNNPSPRIEAAVGTAAGAKATPPPPVLA